MNNRTELVRSLLECDRPLSQILQPLNSFNWDSDSELVILETHHIANVLQRYLDGELSELDVENWANAVESREDIGYETTLAEMLDEAIFELANPVLTRPLSKDSAREWIVQLGGSTLVYENS